MGLVWPLGLDEGRHIAAEQDTPRREDSKRAARWGSGRRGGDVAWEGVRVGHATRKTGGAYHDWITQREGHVHLSLPRMSYLPHASMVHAYKKKSPILWDTTGGGTTQSRPPQAAPGRMRSCRHRLPAVGNTKMGPAARREHTSPAAHRHKARFWTLTRGVWAGEGAWPVRGPGWSLGGAPQG